MKKLNKLVLTGAAGRLGGILRAPLGQHCQRLLSTDLVDQLDPLHPGENYVSADLSDLAAMTALCEGADMIVHFGAIGNEAPFDEILKSNIVGAYNVWEAAYQQGVRRVVYASSIHAVGMYPKHQFIDSVVPHRPDSFYGLAKCFAEDLGSLYWDKRGLESVHLRILSCSGEVTNARALGSWLSDDDLVQLVERAIDTPTVGCSIVYGVSNNDRRPVDNSRARFLGYRPKDNAEVFAGHLLAKEPPHDPGDPGVLCHGGPFASATLGQRGIVTVNVTVPAAEDRD